MATSTETKIIEIKVASADALQRIVVLDKEITNLNNSIDELNKSYKDGKIDEESYTKQKTILTSAIKAHRNELTTLNREIVNNVKQNKEKLGYIQKLEAEVSNLTLKYKQLSEAELKGSKGADVLKNLTAKRDELSQMNQAYGNHTMEVGKYGKATNQLNMQMTQLMREMPNFAISTRIGIMSLTNNLPYFIESMKAVRIELTAMKAAGEKTPSFFAAMIKSIFSFNAVVMVGITLLQLFGDDIIGWIGNLFKSESAIKRVTNEQLGLNSVTEILNKTMKSGGGVYVDAIKSIESLKVKLNAAKGSTELSKAAVDEYNNSLGQTFGKAKNVDDALVKIIKNEEAYIDAMKNMAYANEFFSESAKAAVKSMEISSAKNADILGDNAKKYIDKITDARDRLVNGAVEAGSTATGELTMIKVSKERLQSELDDAILNYNNAAKKERERQIKEISNSQKISLAKAKEYYGEYSKIVKDNGFDVTKSEKIKVNAIKKTFDYEKKLRDASAKSETDDLYQKVEIASASYIEQQDELDKYYKKKLQKHAEYEKKYKKKLVTHAEYKKDNKKKLILQSQYEKLSIAYQTQFTAKIGDIYAAQADKELKIIEEKGKKELELVKKNSKNKQAKIINGLRAEIDILDMKAETAAINNNGEIDVDAEKAILDKQKELDKINKYLELEEKGASKRQIGDAMAAIDDYYLALGVQKERDAARKKQEIAIQYAQSAASVLQGIFDFSSALAQTELDLWAKQNKGKANFDAEYAKKKAKLDREAAVRNKVMQVINATINGAAAVVAQLGTGNVVGAIAAGIVAALQIATIIATPIPSADGGGGGGGGGIQQPPDMTSKMATPLSTSVGDIQATGGSNTITSGAANVNTTPAINYDALANAISKQPPPQLSLVELKRAQNQVDFIDNISTIKS